MDKNVPVTDTKAIFDNIEYAEAQKEYENELKRYFIQTTIFTVIKEMNIKKITDVTEESRGNIKRAINYLHMMDYVQIENTGLSLLGVSEKPSELSYTEKKALKQSLLKELPIFYQPVLKFLEKTDQNVFQTEKLEAQIIDLEEQKRKVLEKLVEVNLQYCEQLKSIADVKFGKHQRNVAEEIGLKFKMNQTKAGLLKALTAENICKQTPHATKAIKEAEHFLDLEIEKKAEKNAEKLSK